MGFPIKNGGSLWFRLWFSGRPAAGYTLRAVLRSSEVPIAGPEAGTRPERVTVAAKVYPRHGHGISALNNCCCCCCFDEDGWSPNRNKAGGQTSPQLNLHLILNAQFYSILPYSNITHEHTQRGCVVINKHQQYSTNVFILSNIGKKNMFHWMQEGSADQTLSGPQAVVRHLLRACERRKIPWSV